MKESARELYREAYRSQRVHRGNGPLHFDQPRITELVDRIAYASHWSYNCRNRRDCVSMNSRVHWRINLHWLPGHVKYCVKAFYWTGLPSFYLRLEECYGL